MQLRYALCARCRTIISRALADEVQRRLTDDGFGDARFADGVVFQHLVGGPVTITTPAEKLGATPSIRARAARPPH